MSSPKELITSADIADMAGVGYSAVSNWKARYADFPAPVEAFRRTVLYDFQEVKEWLEHRARQ